MNVIMLLSIGLLVMSAVCLILAGVQWRRRAIAAGGGPAVEATRAAVTFAYWALMTFLVGFLVLLAGLRA